MGTIALIDWNWVGHHPTYFTHFATAIAKAEKDVVPFCADPEDCLARLGNESLTTAVRSRIHTPQKVIGPQQSGFRPMRWRKEYDGIRFFRGHRKRLRRWEATNGRKIDLVFFACIYDRQFEGFPLAERFLGYPWTGLYLHARSFRMPGSPIPGWSGLPCPEKIFAGPALRSVAVLDEVAVDPLDKITRGKPVFVFPDITEQSHNEEVASLGAKFRTWAAGRPVVSLTGYLQKTKGVAEFVEAATARSMQGVVFILAGSINWNGFSPAERKTLQQVMESAPNIFTHLMELPESTMNSVLKISDVIYAAYRDFPNSSNALTKAAIFERPILVSDSHLMGDRVKRFRLGEVVPEGNVGRVVATLEKMLAPGYQDSLRQCAKWREYREAHSLDRLMVVMQDLITQSTG